MARSLFGALHPAAAWTGDALVVVDPETARAASYDPVGDAWTELAPAPVPFDPSDPPPGPVPNSWSSRSPLR